MLIEKAKERPDKKSYSKQTKNSIAKMNKKVRFLHPITVVLGVE